MRTMLFVVAIAGGVAAYPAQAQQKTKIDSILVTLPLRKDAAMEKVLDAFATVGLPVVDNSGSLVTAEAYSNTSALGVVYTRTVRATVLRRSDSTASVLLIGQEVREDTNDDSKRRLRIDNRAGGNGKKVWRKMVAVAAALDSTQNVALQTEAGAAGQP